MKYKCNRFWSRCIVLPRKFGRTDGGTEKPSHRGAPLLKKSRTDSNLGSCEACKKKIADKSVIAGKKIFWVSSLDIMISPNSKWESL